METIRTLDELKGTLDSVIDEVSESDDAVLVERRGVPQAAIISIEEYRRFRDLEERQRRQQAFAELERIRREIDSRLSDLSNEERIQLAEELSKETMDRIVATGQFRFVDS